MHLDPGTLALLLLTTLLLLLYLVVALDDLLLEDGETQDCANDHAKSSAP